MLPLVCIDVDGTLVGASHEPTQAVWDAAAEAIARGQHLALSTGRGGFGPTLGYARRLDPDGWHIFHNGAAVVHARTGQTIATALDPAVADAADEIAARNGWVLEFYSADDYTVDSDADLAIGHAALLGVEPQVRHRNTLDGELVRVQFVVPLEVVPWVKTEMATLDAVVAPATSPGMVGTAFVSVMSPGVSKGVAIGVMADQMGISVDDVMMVGDGLNDLEALAAAGHGVAMGNAVDEAKAVSDHVVADVEQDGLVEALTLSTTLA